MVHDLPVAKKLALVVHDSSRSLLSGLPEKPSMEKKTVVKRVFQATWFGSWRWIHYNEAEDCVHCHLCLTALKQKLINLTPGDDSAFASSNNNVN